MTDRLDQLYERLLVLRCQAGDEAAFAELVERYGPRLRYFVRRMLDAGDPDDALQEVWLDVFRGLPKLNDCAAFPAWLYRLARDRVLRLLRRKRLPQAPLLDADVPEEARGFTAEDAGQIHEALAVLPPEQREVLVLRFVEGMSYEQIALVVAAPVGTVRSRLHYAKRVLRRILEQKE